MTNQSMDVNRTPDGLGTKMRIGIVDGGILSKLKEAYGHQMMFKKHSDIPQLIYGHRANEDFRLPKENEEWAMLFQSYCARIDQAVHEIAKSQNCNLVLNMNSVLFPDQLDVVDLTGDVVRSLGSQLKIGYTAI